MGSLRTLTILLTLGAWGVATDGSPPDGGAPPKSPSNRPPLAAPAAAYLQGGIDLYQSGDPIKAAKYLKVADDYRDMLAPADLAKLDVYMAKLNPAPVDAAVQPASTDAGSDPSPMAPSPATAPAMTSDPAAAAAATNRGSNDLKQEARWKLQSARDQMRQGNYDEASKLVAAVQQMPIKWGLFDETPAKLAEAIAKARPKAVAAPGTVVRDKKTAVAKLKEAKTLLDNGQFEQAEAIALDVNSWGLSYSPWEPTPKKVADAARSLRKRDATRSMGAKNQPSPGIYDYAVTEARHLAAAGKWDEAEAKAREAMRMNVVPGTTTDRAEDALNDIVTARAAAMTRAQASSVAMASPTATAEPASRLREKQANDMLGKGRTAEAAAMFTEAERLKAMEMAQPPAVAASTALDANVLRVKADGPPALDAPAQGADNPVPPIVEPMPAIGGAAPMPVDPASAPSPMPIPDALGAPSPSLSADGPAAGNKGEELLTQAKALFTKGNYPAARDLVNQAKAGGFGVDAQADEMLAQIGLTEQGGALSVYESALEALRGKAGVKPDYDRARNLLEAVAAMGPAIDEGMMQKVQDLLAKLPKSGAATAVASDAPTNDAETLKVQQFNAEVGVKLTESKRLMETDPEKGIALLQTTLDSVKAADLPQAVSRTMTRRLEIAIDFAKKDKVTFDAKMKDKDARGEIELKKLRILEADKAKREAIGKLMAAATKAQAEGDWAQAEQLAQRAMAIDPNDLAAGALAYKANLQRHYDTSVKDKKDKEEGFLNAMHEVDGAMVINSNAAKNGIDYPKTFTEMSDRRKARALSDVRPKSSSELAIAKKLDEPITLNLKDQTLGEAITFIQNYTGLNVILDPKALNDEGLSKDSKVDIQANSIKLRSALKFMLRPLNLTYKADDDVLLITSPQSSRDKTFSWTYPVADLVISPSKNNVPSPYTPATPALGGGTDTASLMAMANNPANNALSPIQGQRVVTESDMQPLIQLITGTIAPGTWRTIDVSNKGENAYGMGGAFGGAGGADDAPPAQPGSITPFFLSISLIIRHTAEVHEDVAELLKQLRRLQDLQVSVEVRFITVSDDFFEQIGVDFDFNIQSNTVGKNTTFAAPNPAAQLFGTTGANTTGGNTTGGNTTGGTTTGGATGGGATTGGTTAGGTTGGGGGGFAGGGGGGGGAGGGAGNTGGGFAGGGGGTGGAGNFGGGGTGGGNTTGGGTTTSGGSSTNAYLVNPFLDHSLGRRTPLVVGTKAGGIGNFTGNLGIPLTQGSAAAIQPFNAIPTAGATFGISFLSDLEMYLFLTAAQGDARNNIVQAPKVTTFNGAQATITNAELQYYVASLIPIVGAGSVAFFPQPAPLQDGVALNVTPVVSADRRYVRLSLAPFFQTINGLQSFPVPAAVGGGGFGGQATAITGNIQLPLTTTTTINTTVTVPDGGTVLLGGVKRMREQRLEYGVPVLAKTPLINRLFRNIGIGRRTDSLMLMVTPRIIILEEEEERLGVRTVGGP